MSVVDRSPVVVENPDGAGPFVILCDHASNRIPEHYLSLGYAEDALATHIAWDPGALAVSRRMSVRLDAPLIWPDVSRLVIDCNRPTDCIEPDRDRKRRASRAGQSQFERSRRARSGSRFVHAPYHDAIDACLKRRLAAGRDTALVAVHSYTPVYFGKSRPWEIGIVFGEDRRLADRFHRRARGRSQAYGRHQSALRSGRSSLLHRRAPRRIDGICRRR